MTDRSGMRGAVFGKSRSGKTYFVKNRIVKGMDRVIAFDPEEEFCDMPGFIRIGTLQGFANHMHDCWDGNFRVAYVPAVNREEQELSEISRLIERYQEPYKNEQGGEKVTLLADELNLSFPINPNPKNDGFARLCSRGGKRGINIIGITQRPAEVGTRFRGNLDRVAVFDLSLSNDWKAVEQYVGADGLERLRKAPKYSHLSWEDGDVKLIGPT